MSATPRAAQGLTYVGAGTDRARPVQAEAHLPPDPAISVQPFLIREAVAQDVASIRTWLPDALGGTPAATLVVATDARTGEVAGVAALRVFVDRVGRFLLFVNPAFRRRGCGTALMRRIRQVARVAEATRLLTGRSSEAGADDAGTLAALAFLRARGLSVAQEIVRWRAELKTAMGVLEPLYKRYEKKPTDPRRAHTVTADRVGPRWLAEFVVRHVGGYAEEVAARLSGYGPPFSLATSMVALVDNTIVGALLCRTQGYAILVEALAVEASHRGAGINLALLHHSIAAAERLGIRTVELEHDGREHNMAKLGRRFSATTVGLRQCWGCSPPVTLAEYSPDTASLRAVQ